jgi:membrane protease subunit HflK
MPDPKISDFVNIPPELKQLGGKVKYIVIIALLILFSSSSFFTVETEEVGVITTFGKYNRTVNPGLNFKWPLIEHVDYVAVERQQKIEFGFKTEKVGVRSEYSRNAEQKNVALMLTGDLNLADVEWVIQYRIKNAKDYLFKVKNAESTLRDISEATMRQIVGDRTVNEVITVGRTQMSMELKTLLQKVCDDYSLGVKIQQVVLQDVNPPGPVKGAFNAVNEAEQEKETLINRAKEERNKIIPKAKGQANETIQKAEGYATERVNIAKGEVARFNAIYKEYIKAPEVTRRRIYLETMAEVLPKLGNKIITDDKGSGVLPLLQMQLKKASNAK